MLSRYPTGNMYYSYVCLVFQERCIFVRQLRNHASNRDSDLVLTHVTHCVYKKQNKKVLELLSVVLGISSQ